MTTYTTAGERLVDAAHELGLCSEASCHHFENDGLSDTGKEAAQILLDAFYDYTKPELDVEGAPV